MRALWLADALRGAGLNVVEQPGVDLTAGAYVQVYTYQTSGAGLNAMNDTTDYFSLRFLGPT